MRIERSDVIKCPRRTVWYYESDPTHLSTYYPRFVDFQFTSPPPMGVGSTARARLKVGPARIPVTVRWTDWVEYETNTWRNDDNSLPVVQTATYSDVDGGTRVTWHAELMPRNPVESVIARWLGPWMAREQVASWARLKAVLEQPA